MINQKGIFTMPKIHLDFIAILIYLIWPVIFITACILYPRFVILIFSICGLIGLALIKSDEKYEHNHRHN